MTTQETNQSITHQAIVFTLNRKKDDIGKTIVTEEEYALDTSQIREIMNYEKPTRLPGKQPTNDLCILGVLNVRGEIIPLMDLGYRLHHEIDYDKSKIIITYKNNEKIGLIVQSVKDVINYTESELEIAPTNDIDFILGLIKKEEVSENESGKVTKSTRLLTMLNSELIIKDEYMSFELID